LTQPISWSIFVFYGQEDLLAENLNVSGWATYLRVSDEDKQTPERSFAMQRQRIQEQLIGTSEVPFKREYRDMLTGTSPNRADYQKLLADAEAGKFSHLGLYRADRFGRDTVEGLQAATRLIRWGIKIRVAHMPSLMPETPDGFFMFLLQRGWPNARWMCCASAQQMGWKPSFARVVGRTRLRLGTSTKNVWSAAINMTAGLSRIRE
jgi:hypothetical protein